MTVVDPRDPMFHDEDKAREYFETQRWPDGNPFCAHCGSTNVHRLEGKSHRAGLLQCNDCLGAFTVTTKSVMESSHVPLTKWALAFHKMAASKKGISALQMQRELNLGSYRTAWFVCMRVREAMKLPKMAMGRLGGEGKTLESDETFVGGKKKNVHKGKPEPRKHAVHALVERGGGVRATHVPDVSAKTLRSVLREACGSQVGAPYRRRACEPIVGQRLFRAQDGRTYGTANTSRTALVCSQRKRSLRS